MTAPKPPSRSRPLVGAVYVHRSSGRRVLVVDNELPRNAAGRMVVVAVDGPGARLLVAPADLEVLGG